MKYTFKDLLTSVIWLILAGTLVALDTYVLNNFIRESISPKKLFKT